jgi:hypothetical protein
MLRLVIALSISTLWMACAKIDTKEVCKGEWSYIVGDTAYCELLIERGHVFPYHNNELNSYSYPYKIQNDTFYLYGNEGTIVEKSPIKYLDPNTFQILAITPSPLQRISYTEAAFNSLSKYQYRVQKLTLSKSVVELYDQKIFEKIDDARSKFEPNFQERRSIALYKLNKEKTNQNSN